MSNIHNIFSCQNLKLISAVHSGILKLGPCKYIQVGGGHSTFIMSLKKKNEKLIF